MDCHQAVTLDCVRDLYNFHYTPIAGKRNTVGVGQCSQSVGQIVDSHGYAAEFGAEFYLPSDFDMFFQMYEPSLVGHQPTLVSIEGGKLNVHSGAVGMR